MTPQFVDIYFRDAIHYRLSRPTLAAYDLYKLMLRGMVTALGSAVLIFLFSGTVLAQDSPVTNQRTDIDGIQIKSYETFDGVGMRPTKKDNQFEVFSVLEGYPAARSGIKPRDQILSVDGKAVKGMTLSEISSLIRGIAGTEVLITVTREGVAEPIEFRIVRETIDNESNRALEYWCNNVDIKNKEVEKKYFERRSRCIPWPGGYRSAPEPFYWGIKNISLYVQTEDHSRSRNGSEEDLVTRDMLIEAFQRAITKELLPYADADDQCQIPKLHVLDEGRHVEEADIGGRRVRLQDYRYLKNNIDPDLKAPIRSEDDTLTVVVSLSYAVDTSPKLAIVNVSQIRWKKECRGTLPRYLQSLAIPLDKSKEQILEMINKFAKDAARIKGWHGRGYQMLRYRCDNDADKIEVDKFTLWNGKLDYDGVILKEPEQNPLQEIGGYTYYLVKNDFSPLVCRTKTRNLTIGDGYELTLTEKSGEKKSLLLGGRTSGIRLRSFAPFGWHACVQGEDRYQMEPVDMKCADVSVANEERWYLRTLILRDAAQKGDQMARKELGRVYHLGESGPDYPEAYFWYLVANDVTTAQTVGHHLSDAEMSMIQKRVVEWKAKHPETQSTIP